jgi:L-threonylcarbamoyladenylate synthase
MLSYSQNKRKGIQTLHHIPISGPNDRVALQRIRDIMSADGVIAYPTDTIYGLGCDPKSVSALERIYSIKGRSHEKPLLILLDSATRLSGWCRDIPHSARSLISRWPAPLTLIFTAASGLPASLMRSSSTLGFRVPASPLCRSICTACGGVLTSTSANISGKPPVNSPKEIHDTFSGEIDALVDAGNLPSSLPSTVVRCVGDKNELIRPGAFPFP